MSLLVSQSAVRAGAVSLAVAIVLLGTKLAAYLATHSAAILSDALESIVNVVAAGFGLFALRIASRPPDPSHPYGHGKIEFLAAGFEGGMIGVAALLILIESIRRLFVGVELERLGLGILLAGGAGVVNLLLGLYLVRAGKRHESATLVADGKHVLTDVVTTGAALVGLGLVHLLGWEAADPIAAIAAALWILRSGYHLVREAVAGLMDEADPEDVARLTEAMGRVVEPQLRGWDDLRSRHQGRLHLIDVTIFVPATITVDEGHDVADRVEAALERCFPHARATCHVEPAPPPQGSSPP